jgi:hypothetical protein
MRQAAAVGFVLLATDVRLASAQSSPGPDDAQRFAATVRPLLDVIGGLADKIPINEASRAALSSSADSLKQLNDDRAQAEAIMNDPTGAFLPRASEPLSLLPLCPARSPYTCNPIGVPMRVVRMDPRRAYTNECSMTTSVDPPTSGYVLVDCMPSGGTMTYRVKRQAPRLSPDLQTIVPTVTRRYGNIVETDYTGYRFLDPCMPCR